MPKGKSGGGRFMSDGGRADGARTPKKRRGPKSALSLDAFARAKRSTYDKRAALEKKRNLAAARVNKYRKVQRRLGGAVEVDDGFDPEKYAARLEALDAENPSDDGFGGRGGRAPLAADAPGRRRKAAKREREEAEEGREEEGGSGREGGEDRESDDDDDDDDEFANNVVDREDDGGGDGGKTARGAKPGVKSGKGWNKTVKDQLRWEKEKAARDEEMKELRAKWAEEDKARRAFFAKRNEQRGKFRKKNSRGQPVMKHRVDKILETLQKEAGDA